MPRVRILDLSGPEAREAKSRREFVVLGPGEELQVLLYDLSSSGYRWQVLELSENLEHYHENNEGSFQKLEELSHKQVFGGDSVSVYCFRARSDLQRSASFKLVRSRLWLGLESATSVFTIITLPPAR